jgi:hypothetical protein
MASDLAAVSRGARFSALERLRGLVAASEVLDGELVAAVRLARAEGASPALLAWILGVDRSTLYRRYLSGQS